MEGVVRPYISNQLHVRYGRQTLSACIYTTIRSINANSAIIII
jgi:hypothetical protein